MYAYNGHGDTTSLIQQVDNSIVFAETYEYDAFGNTTSMGLNEDKNPFRYNGQYTDDETGLIYLRNRYYDPEIGRFISEDPIRDGLNWYVYCSGNPVAFVDPSGLDAILITNKNSVGLGDIAAGHTSAIYQDGKTGEWYYTYWGNGAAAVIHIPQESMQSLDAFNGYLNKYLNDNGFVNITSDYTDATYVVGDFTESLNSAIDNVSSIDGYYSYVVDQTKINYVYIGKNDFSSGEYNLVFNNCLQRTMDEFSKGTLAGGISAKEYLKENGYSLFANTQYMGNFVISEMVIPNSAKKVFSDIFMNDSFTLEGAYPAILSCAKLTYGISNTTRSRYSIAVVDLMFLYD